MTQNQKNKKAQESKQPKPKEIKIIASTTPKEVSKDKNSKAPNSLSSMNIYPPDRTSYNKDMEEMLHNYQHPDPETHRIIAKDNSTPNTPHGAKPEF